MSNRRLILDTNVCDKLRDPSRIRIRKRINRDFRIVVSPNTFAELLHSIKGVQTDEHFEIRKERIRIMTGNQRPIFLPFPGQFALKFALKMEEAPVKLPLVALGPKDFRLWHRVVMNARSRADLQNADVVLPLHRERFGFDVDLVDAYQAAGKRLHRLAIERVRDGKSKLGSAAEWAAMIAHDMGRELSIEQAQAFAGALDAAYEYEKQLCEIVKNGKFNFDNHDGDWIDMQQLFYLADPTVCFLTEDKDIRQRCGSSVQSKRILLLKEI
jgi:hypothetical protein